MPTIEDLQSQTSGNQDEASRDVARSRSAANPSLVDFKRILFKHRYLILSIVVISLIISVIYAKTRIRLYEASATAEIDESQSNSMSLGGVIFSDMDPDTLIQTDLIRITGDSLIFRAVGELALQHKGPYPDSFKGVSLPITDDSLPPDDRLAIIGSVKGGISVTVIPKTSAIRVSFRYPDPVVARDVVNKLLAVYMARSVEDKLFTTQQAAEMLGPQIEELKNHAADAQRDLAKYQAEHALIGSESADDSGGSNLNVDQLKTLNQQLADAQADLMVKSARLQLVQSTNPENLFSVVPTPTLQALRSQLDAANARLTELKTKYGSGYPAVHQLELQIPQLEKEISAEASNVRRRVQEEYDTSSGTVHSIQQRLNDTLQKVYKVNEGAAQYALLREDAASSGDLYNALQLKLKESSVTAALDAASISVIDHAVVRPVPVVPDTRRIMMTGGLCGIILGVFLALGLEALDDTIETSEDVENSSKLYSLGAVPHFEMMPAAKDSAGTGRAKLPSRLVTMNAKDSLASESFRGIRSAILLSAVDSPKKCILVTSSFMAEGKSTLSSNLAVALAQKGERVLLADTDLRRGTLSSLFDLSGTLPGLSNILGRLEEGSPYLHPIESLPNLTFLPAGIKVPNPAELLASTRMSALMAQWREEYDHIVLDSAPILMVSDSLPIAARADGVVLVVRSGTTRKTALSRSYDLLSRSSANILGAVINDVDLRMENYYTYSTKGYGYGYSHNKKYGGTYGSPYGKPYGDDRKDDE